MTGQRRRERQSRNGRRREKVLVAGDVKTQTLADLRRQRFRASVASRCYHIGAERLRSLRRRGQRRKRFCEMTAFMSAPASRPPTREEIAVAAHPIRDRQIGGLE